MPTEVLVQSDLDSILARLDAIELRLDGMPPPIDPPPIDPPPIDPPPIDPPPVDPPPSQTDVPLSADLVVNSGTLAYDSAEVYSADTAQRKIITVRDGAKIVAHGSEFRDTGRMTLDMPGGTNKFSEQTLWIHKAADGCEIGHCSFHDTASQSPYRYGFTVCQSSNGSYHDNLVDGKSAAGIWTMTGNERGNVFADNVCQHIRGTQMPPNPEPDWPASREPADWTHAGYGFAARSGGNKWLRNIARYCPVGYLLWFQHLVGDSLICGPGEFVDNLAEDCFYDGLQPWRIGWSDDPQTFPPLAQSIIENFTARRCGRYGVYNYYVRWLKYLNLTVESCKVGYQGGDYPEVDLSFANFVARNCGVGYQPSTATGGVVTMDGAVMENNGCDVLFRSLYSSGGPTAITPREVRLTNADLRSAVKVRMYRDDIQGQNHTVADKLWLNGRRVYYKGQKAGDIMPASDPANNTVGCPVAGLTNKQAFEQYGVCLAGEIAPEEAHEEPGIEGLIV